MTSQRDKAVHFLDLHRGGEPLLIPNPWDAGSAKLLASLGFDALATTSSGFAGTLGRLDGSVTRDEALAHAALIAAAVDVPVSADFENGFADRPEDVADTIALAIDAGLAGCSIEDFTRRRDDPIYDASLAAERIAAAAEAAHGDGRQLVLTARAAWSGRPQSRQWRPLSRRSRQPATQAVGAWSAGVVAQHGQGGVGVRAAGDEARVGRCQAAGADTAEGAGRAGDGGAGVGGA